MENEINSTHAGDQQRTAVKQGKEEKENARIPHQSREIRSSSGPLQNIYVMQQPF